MGFGFEFGFGKEIRTSVLVWRESINSWEKRTGCSLVRLGYCWKVERKEEGEGVPGPDLAGGCGLGFGGAGTHVQGCAGSQWLMLIC